MSYFPKPSLNENDLAIIERGDTAAHSIEAGQYVSWHGRTGKAKAAILQGTTMSDSLFDYDEDGVLNASYLQVVSGNDDMGKSYKDTYYSKTIQYGTTFKTIPTIVISPTGNGVNSTYELSDITTSSFKIGILPRHSNISEWKFIWTAFALK